MTKERPNTLSAIHGSGTDRLSHRFRRVSSYGLLPDRKSIRVAQTMDNLAAL